MVRSRKRKESLDNRIFNGIVTFLLVLCGLAALYPLLFVVVASISDPVRVNSGEVWLFPVGFQLDGYLQVFGNKWIFIGYRNSLIYTVLGTFLNVLVTLMAGYPLSRKDLYGRKLFNWYIQFFSDCKERIQGDALYFCTVVCFDLADKRPAFANQFRKLLLRITAFP